MLDVLTAHLTSVLLADLCAFIILILEEDVKMTSRSVPEELRAERRWSSFQEPQAAPQWTRATDERLMALVTRSTVSGERFPVGVNCTSFSYCARI